MPLKRYNCAKIKMDPPREPIRVNRYFFIKKSCPDIQKLNFTSNTKLSSHSPEEWTALINLKNRNDFVIKAADKSGATIICRITALYKKEAIFGPDFLHQRQQRPNPRQFKSCQRHHSRTHNQKRTTNHPKSHHHYSSYLMHLIQT